MDVIKKKVKESDNGENYLLSNDPDKNCSIFYCSAAIRLLHIETVVFLDGEAGL